MDSIANKLSLKKALIVDIKEELPANAVISTYLFHNEFVVSGKLEVHGKEELLYVLTNKKDFDFDAYIVESGNLAEDALGDLKRDILDIDPKSCVGFYRREDLKSEFLVGWLNNPSGRKDAGSVIIYSPFLGLVKALTERCHSLREIYLVDENFERLWDIQKACAPGKNIFILTPDERPQNLDIEARFFAVLSDTAFSKYPHLFKFLQKDGEIIIFDNAEIPQKTDYLLKQKKIKVVKGDISIFMASKIYETLRMKTFD